MKNLLPNLAGVVLGLLFLMAGGMFLLGMVPKTDPPPEGSPMAHFFAALAPTGYLTFVKVCEVLGGLLVMIPRTRCLGLLVLGPIALNILAFHLFVGGASGLAQPMTAAALLLPLYLLWAERKAFAALVRSPRA